MVKNQELIFTEIPKGELVKGQHLKLQSQDLDLDNVKLNGGILVKTLVLSLDPYQRGRMRSPEIKSYIHAFTLGQPIQNFGILRVLRSEHQQYKKGELLYCPAANFREYDVINSEEVFKSTMKLDELQQKYNLPLTNWVGGAGMPSKTASFGLQELGQPKKGETIFISSASGAVGQIVGQLAKAKGLFVIGSAGTDEKCKHLKEIGFDAAINYKAQDLDEELTKIGRPIDINFENVGGETLDILLKHMNVRGRVVLCGLISQYQGQSYGLKNVGMILGKMLTVKGFIILYEPQWDKTFYNEIPGMIAGGKLKLKEDITEGLENAEDAFLGLLAGRNHGKATIRVAKDD